MYIYNLIKWLIRLHYSLIKACFVIHHQNLILILWFFTMLSVEFLFSLILQILLWDLPWSDSICTHIQQDKVRHAVLGRTFWIQVREYCRHCTSSWNNLPSPRANAYYPVLAAINSNCVRKKKLMKFFLCQ